MCELREWEMVRVKICADYSPSGKAYWKEIGIDRCIAPLVRALQEGGIDMRASCCGHGEGYGVIVLEDTRVLHINHDRTRWDPGDDR